MIAAPPADAPPAPRVGSAPARAFAALVVALRWPVVLGWIGITIAALVLLPPLSTRSAGLSDLTNRGNPAVQAEERAAQAFGFPLLSRTLLVQHDPEGLSDQTRTKALDTAVKLAERTQQQGVAGSREIVAALPIINDEKLVPGSKGTGTTIVTYLYPAPGLTFGGSIQAAERYAAQLDPKQDGVAGVTGAIPARIEQTQLVNRSLPLIELVSVLAVLVIVGLAFRSLAAPVLTVVTAGISYVLVSRVAAALAERYGFSIPADLEPLMVALMVGVTTDYVVYFLAGLRGELVDGHPRVPAARRAVATFAPIVAAAGLTVAAGVATLLVAKSPAVRVFGPAMAIAVTVALVVALTFVPASMAILGRFAFWPSPPRAGERPGVGALLRTWVSRALTVRFVALLLAAGSVVGLAVVAWPAKDLGAGLPLLSSLPADSDARRAAEAAEQGFPPGIVAPTLVAVQGPGVRANPEAANRLEQLLAEQPHVAAVLGPREDEVVSRQAGRPTGIFLREAAAQYVLVLDVDPLDAVGVTAVDDVRERLPDLVREAGLPADTWSGTGGDTAAVAALVDETRRDLGAILLAALLVNFLILALILRAVVAPLLLLACTLLSVAATIGITVLVFQESFGNPGVTFFVPLAAGVLLVSLGSDYNLFAVGHVWEEARRLPLREAIVAALPRSSGAITTAGLALAASLGALALVPLVQFKELAFALGVGILLDTFVVRTLLVPSLLTLVGPASGWPGSRLRRDRPAGAPEDAARSSPAWVGEDRAEPGAAR